jgi:hypothetical protein
MTPSSQSEPENRSASTGNGEGSDTDATKAGSSPVVAESVEATDETVEPSGTTPPTAATPKAEPTAPVEPAEPAAPTAPTAPTVPVSTTPAAETVEVPADKAEAQTSPALSGPLFAPVEPAPLDPAPAAPPVAGAPVGDHDAHDHDHDHAHDHAHAHDDDDLEVLSSGDPDRFPTLVPLAGVLAALTALAVLLLVGLALPAVKSAPKDVPIGVGAENPQFVQQLSQLFGTGAWGKEFDVSEFKSDAALRKAIEERDVYGGLAITANGPVMMVSSAASVRAADELSAVANLIGQQNQAQIPVNDVVALPKKDPHGEGLSVSGLPIVIGSVLPALFVIVLYRRRPGAQIGVAAGASVLIGLALAAVLDYALGTTSESNFLLVSVSLAAGVLASSLLLIGLNAVAGRWAAGIGALALVLFAAPLSGLSSAPEWLPSPWGAIGQFLPPGADASLLRSFAFFDGKGAAQPGLVLAIWGLVGLFLVGVGYLISSGSTPPPPSVEEELTQPSPEPVGV